VPQVIITERAGHGLERCRRFLAVNNPKASQRAAKTIIQQLTILETNPDIGRLLDNDSVLRELIIPFGSSGYAALYQYDAQANIVYILAFRHQKEAGY
jgi:plasmid stabilization system protein ParE